MLIILSRIYICDELISLIVSIVVMGKKVHMRKSGKESHSVLYLDLTSDTAAHVHNYYEYKYLYLKKILHLLKKTPTRVKEMALLTA